MKRLGSVDLRVRFHETLTQAKADAKRWRVYKDGRLRAGCGDEDTARRLASVIGDCTVRQ